VVFKQFPLPNHKNARDAARIAILAQEHGKFWEVHDALFENMKSLGEETYLKIARDNGIPEADVKRVLAEKAYELRISKEYAEGQKYKVNSTPTSFVNGKRVKGAQPYEGFQNEVDAALTKKGVALPPKKEAAAKPVEAPKKPAQAKTVKPGAPVGVGKAPILGPEKADVTIVHFTDYQ